MEDVVVRQSRVALVALAIGCGSTSPPREAPAVTPTITAGFSSYPHHGLTIDGPPLDEELGKRRDGLTSETARMLDLAPIGSLGPYALVSTPAGCGVLAPRLGAEVRRTLDPCGGWARHRKGGIVWLDEREDETSSLVIGDRTLTPIGRVVDPIWSFAGNRAFYGLATDRPAELWMSTAEGQHTRIAGDGPWSPLDVSQDGMFVLARREVSTTRAGLYLIEVATGNAVALVDPELLVTRAKFAGSDVLAIVERDDRRRLEWISTWWRRSIELRGDVVDVGVSSRGIVAIVEDAGFSTLWQVDVTGQPHLVQSAPDGGVLRDLVVADDLIGFTFSDATHPREARVIAFDDTPRAQWPLDRRPSPQPELHEIAASDAVRVQLLAYLPTQDKAPVILELHGGPEDYWLPKYDRFVELATSEGVAVVRPNVRGSAGQGTAFLSRDNGALRPQVLRDLAATLDWIATQPKLDASRVVVMGTSYGGYLALAALHAFPDRLRGGITLSAITDLVGFLEGTAPYRRDHRRAEYGDERDPATRAVLHELSPIAWAGELSHPLLMAYGQLDPRVPPLTAAKFLTAVRGTGAPVWSIVANNEGHWFERPENRRAFEVLALQFVARVAGPEHAGILRR